MFKNSLRGIPVKPVERKTKVVSIPVHFFTSETTRSTAALKIQKVFRGFIVRKSVKKIASIRREVEEIERRVSRRETVELIRRENKERLRLNETLMALLFKLDSVRGVDSGVRDFRKVVIKKAIALQERVDAMASGNQALETQGTESGINSPYSDLTDDNNNSIDNQTSEIKQSVEVSVNADDSTNQTSGIEVEEPEDEEEADVNDCICSENSVDESVEVHCPDEPEAVSETKEDEKMDIAEAREDSEAKADEEDCIVKQIVEVQFPKIESAEEHVETDSQVSTEIGDENSSQGRKDQKRNTELLERMIDDNEKMMNLITQLYEKNEMQTRMLSSLTQRVEQLESAFICDRLRKKKKNKRHAVGTVDCSESSPDQQKCGKR